MPYFNMRNLRLLSKFCAKDFPNKARIGDANNARFKPSQNYYIIFLKALNDYDN